MLSIYCILSIAILVYSATAILSHGKPKSKQPLLSRPVTAGQRYAPQNHPSKAVPIETKVVDNGRQVRLEHEDEMQEMLAHKDMYYKLHNLEDFQDILPCARNQLITLFAETLDTALKKQPNESILRLDAYSREGLTGFMRDQDEMVNQQWEEYIERRKQGGPRELFKDRDEARWWLKQISPVKYVDGAWLGYINKITLPFALRPVMKKSWQVLSEELGDGDLDKNHVYLYRELTKTVALELPASDAADFIHPRHDMTEPVVWKAALAQLLISLIPHEFFPEILGFNMHFEATSLQTLKASRELKEVGLDPYYFTLHVSIDNADSGHTAIALEAVCVYIEQICRTKGATAAQQAWRRVQVGYILSDGLPSDATCPSLRRPAVDRFPRNELEAEVIKIFRAKALVGHKIHSPSDIKIGGTRLVDWLDPVELASKQRQMDFLDNFGHSKPWVYRGNSSKSRFIKLLSWGGGMFGAFTQSETNIVKRWIDAMPSSQPQLYWEFTGRVVDLTSPKDSSIHLSSNDSKSLSTEMLEKLSNASVSSPLELPAAPFGLKFGVNITPDIAKFLPLWFAHPCLLETFVSIPWKTTNQFACSVVRILRAQAGFGIEFGVVAGIDEANRTDVLGLVELGQEMLRNWGLPEMGSLREVLEYWDSQFAATMIHLATRPFANKSLLIGMAMAFASLHTELASSNVLCRVSQEALSEIARREMTSLGECLAELEESERKDCSRGYWLVAAQLSSCFAGSQW